MKGSELPLNILFRWVRAFRSRLDGTEHLL